MVCADSSHYAVRYIQQTQGMHKNNRNLLTKCEIIAIEKFESLLDDFNANWTVL